jgi:hypothetical protein
MNQPPAGFQGTMEALEQFHSGLRRPGDQHTSAADQVEIRQQERPDRTTLAPVDVQISQGLDDALGPVPRLEESGRLLRAEIHLSLRRIAAFPREPEHGGMEIR